MYAYLPLCILMSSPPVYKQFIFLLLVFFLLLLLLYHVCCRGFLYLLLCGGWAFTLDTLTGGTVRAKHADITEAALLPTDTSSPSPSPRSRAGACPRAGRGGRAA